MKTKSVQQSIPPEAAQIMKRMVSMPPRPHEDMKVGKPKGKAGKSPKEAKAHSEK